MKYISKIFAFTISIFISTSAIAAPETYSFESNHTTVEWRANHFGFSNPSGKFMDVQGTIKLDEADPANSSVNVTIIPASISTGITKFDDHLKNSDFFNVEKFSTATFTSNKVEIVDKNKAKVHGTLSLMDIKKDIV
ncbi:MAG: YceI family protein, partial [Rickettsiales bacterium]